MISIVSIIALIMAITIHEFSHALIADRLGDPTPRANGRLSLNPLAHADPIGTFLLPLLSALTGIPTIGWAKPVPIDPYNLKNPRRDELFIALAGPVSNLILAVVASLLLRFPLSQIVDTLIYLIILVNISIAIFNLIPLWPLDGSKILLNLLPPDTATEWQAALSRYSFPLLLILLFLPVGHSGLLQTIMGPVVNAILHLLLSF